ncbi:MAG: Y4yA family PLP-dependent enzyme [Dactylosporangium sp.]|nr:Y4yA family PLP-dependent enzyme [Dactylosporangium sp.]NNJ63613.1 Y4yA family PLP-dependent enzyme [Dactylosporangium sp.]
MGCDPLYLDPRINGPLRMVLDQSELLAGLVDALGSPLNVVLPDQVAANVAAFRSVYARHRLRGTIYFANKASRSSALLRALAATEAGVDVASLNELRHALGSGFAPTRVLATGPKTEPFLWLAARSGASVHLDSLAELRGLIGIVEDFGLPPVRVVPRLCGFEHTGARVLTRPSRFGIEPAALGPVVDLLVARRDVVDCAGVGYHLDTSSLEEKAAALEACVVTLDDLRRGGLTPSTVDIGGGFGVTYLADVARWDRYTTALTEAVLGTRPPLTWQGHGYGLRAESGTIRGTLRLYPAARTDAAHTYLDRLLATPGPRLGRGLSTVLLENLVDLDIEPGRALLDQCGLTLARVAEVGYRAGQCLIRVEANRDDISFEAGGVLVDPLVLPRDPAREARPCQAYLVGNLSLEHDFLTHRLVALRHTPACGDLLAFVNTAGYFSDFSAGHALRQPVATTVAVAVSGAGTWRWCHDEQYWPTLGACP